MKPRWHLVLAAGIAASAIEFAIPEGLLRDLVFTVISLVALGMAVIGVRLQRPARATAWGLIIGGLALWAAGDLTWAVTTHVLHIDPFPSVADAFYLLAYPVLAGGLYLLASGRARRTGDHSMLIDVLIVGLVATTVLWVTFIDPTWTEPEGLLADRLLKVAYPVGDLMLMTQLVHLGAASRLKSRAVRLLGGALTLTLIGDVLFQLADYQPFLAENIVALDPLWLGGYVLCAAAVLHPSMRTVGEGRPAADSAFRLGRLLFIAAAVGTLPLICVVESLLGVRVHVLEVAAVCFALIVLVMLRMVGLIRRMRGQTERLAHLADVDFLTGLDNRRRFTELVEQALGEGHPASATGPALLLVGLERFTELNDTLGHRTGDELLRAVAKRLRGELDPTVRIARMGGDVFGILLPARASPDVVLSRARAVRALLVEPLMLSDLSVTIEGAVGMVDLPCDGTDAAEVLHRADVALTAARETSSRVAHYTDEMENGGTLAPVLMAELRSALTSGEVVVHFQPQVEVHTGRVFGAEALVRWQHPEHGLLAPLTFVPAAERTGLIRVLTLHVLDRALAECAAWSAGGRTLTVAVNLSVRNLLDPGLVGDVRADLVRHGVDASMLELEITETMAMVDPTRAVEVLGALDAMGVTLSVDDYGTGYGSLAYLQRLPVRRLKIDRSFVSGILDDPASAAIVRSTIDLAHHLGLSVVAEGVEDDATLLALRDMQCYGAQGFGLGRPTPPAELDAVLARIDRRLPALLGSDELSLRA